MRRRAGLAIGVMAMLATFQPVGTVAGSDHPAAKHYANCTKLNQVYPHGVGKVHAHDHVSSGTPVTNFKRSNALYNANQDKDRDGDKVACEKH